ncbi:MAG TPA: aldehyde dehydrogenase family protein [Phycisphaerae bacterium]|nr:aldehyde dehydrogenase family protein [Phycisphaerae bacterium]
MKPALLLVDLQKDYLNTSNLQPAAERITDIAANLLGACRKRSIPIIHLRTAVHRKTDDRMPHWKAAGCWMCELNTPGYDPPESLREIPGETVVEKQFFSGFGNPQLSMKLRELGSDTLFIAGLQLHACVRTTALDAYEQGLKVWITEDAVTSNDALHAAITRRYLAARHISFAPAKKLIEMFDTSGAHNEAHTEPIERRSWKDNAELLWTVRPNTQQEISEAATRAKIAWESWRKTSLKTRGALLHRLANLLEVEENNFARQITQDIGKPINMSCAEVQRSAALIRATANHDAESLETLSSEETYCRYLPLGVVAAITPWNNSLAIPAGKIAPALFYGNTVVWKPSPHGSMVAQLFLRLIQTAFESYSGPLPIELCIGDQRAGLLLAENSHVNAVSLSGSLSAGYALQEICTKRHIPFQGELGGNNAAIVWDDADPQESMVKIASGAFGFAGQRCTANRRLIVSEKLHGVWLRQLEHATQHTVWGDPWNPKTTVGPVIDAAKRDDLVMLVDRACKNGSRILVPHMEQKNYAELFRSGAYYPPTIVCCDEPDDEIVQEETFGPVLVVQTAKDFDHAIQLCNGVRQGLAAALFTNNDRLKQEFLNQAQAGILKINCATADADATSPFGGWKASGVGPAEHGSCDREFFCRVQTVYAPHDRTADFAANLSDKTQNVPKEIPL